MKFDFYSRIHFIDTLLNHISFNKKTKFYILSLLHTAAFLPIWYVLLFSKNISLNIIILIILSFTLTLNLIDDGCMLLKLERKYIGKHWYGFYTPFIHYFNYDKNNIILIYYLFTLTVIFGLFIKLYYLFGLFDEF
jgi:hypothetical protein